jgi:hypothetical protein
MSWIFAGVVWRWQQAVAWALQGRSSVSNFKAREPWGKLQAPWQFKSCLSENNASYMNP